jgi:hypothetical protein
MPEGPRPTLVGPGAPARVPGWRRLSRGAYRWLLRAHPPAAFLLAGIRSRLARDRFRHTPSPEEVAAYWPGLPPARCYRIARDIRTVSWRNRDLRELVEQAGVERLAAVVRCRGGERLRDLAARKQPAILVSWHFRTHHVALLAALRRLGLPALVVWLRPNEVPPGFEVCSPEGGCTQRALVLRRALEYLRGGGFVVIAMDLGVGTPARLPFLGCRLTVRRGPAVLARLSGAPVIPLSQRWEPLGRAITVTVHDPVPRPACPPGDAAAFEDAILAAVARWAEDFVRAFPHEFCFDVLTDSQTLERPADPGPVVADGPLVRPATPRRLHPCAE